MDEANHIKRDIGVRRYMCAVCAAGLKVYWLYPCEPCGLWYCGRHRGAGPNPHICVNLGK